MFLGLNWKLKISNHCTKYLARHWRISFLKKYIFYKINPERFTSTGLLQRDGIYRVPIVCRNLWSQVSLAHFVKAHSHYCVFRVSLWQTVVLLHRDRKIPISVLTQSTVESADCCGECEWALRNVLDWCLKYRLTSLMMYASSLYQIWSILYLPETQQLSD